MKLKFSNYTYYDPNDDSEDKDYTKIKGPEVYNSNNADNFKNKMTQYMQLQQYTFNQSTFDEYMSKREYDSAADYASKFIPNDPKEREQWENNILNLRREGRKLRGMYNMITDEYQKKGIEFYDNLFVDGGFDYIKDNPYINEFSSFKRRLGSELSYLTDLNLDVSDNINKEATKLSIEFEPKTRKFIIDALKKDNKYSIETFYENSGLTEKDLINAGISLEKQSNGNTKITFDKSNPLANTIIVNSLLKIENGDITYSGLDENGNIITSNHITNGMDKDRYGFTFTDTIELIEKAKKDKDKLNNEIASGKYNFTTTVTDYLDDNLVEIDEAYEKDRLTFEQWNKMRDNYKADVKQLVTKLGSGNYEMYSNWFNKEFNDETLDLVDDNINRGLLNLILSSNAENIQLNTMISDGVAGTLITIDANEKKLKQGEGDPNDTNIEDKLAQKKIQVFIPGLFDSKAQQKINADTNCRASQELNDMQMYNYSYKDVDNNYVYAKSGKFYYGNTEDPDKDIEISKSEAVQKISKSMAIEDLTTNLKYNYLNKKGDVYDYEGYELTAKIASIKLANELYPDIQLDDPSNYKTQLEYINSIFDKKGVGAAVSYDYLKKLQFGSYDKYTEVFRIYEKLMSALNAYNIYNYD